MNCKKVNGFSTDVIITCMVVKQKQKRRRKITIGANVKWLFDDLNRWLIKKNGL